MDIDKIISDFLQFERLQKFTVKCNPNYELSDCVNFIKNAKLDDDKFRDECFDDNCKNRLSKLNPKLKVLKFDIWQCNYNFIIAIEIKTNRDFYITITKNQLKTFLLTVFGQNIGQCSIADLDGSVIIL